jgi:hypothetical protein
MLSSSSFSFVEIKELLLGSHDARFLCGKKLLASRYALIEVVVLPFTSLLW